MSEQPPNQPPAPNNPAPGDPATPARPKLIIPGQQAPPAQPAPAQPQPVQHQPAAPTPAQPQAVPPAQVQPATPPAPEVSPAPAPQPQPTPYPQAATPETQPAQPAAAPPTPESQPTPPPEPTPQAQPEPTPAPQPAPTPATPVYQQPAQPTPAPVPQHQATPPAQPQAQPAPTPAPQPQAAPTPPPAATPQVPAAPAYPTGGETQVTVPLAGTPVPAQPQAQTPPAPAAAPLQVGGYPGASPTVAPPGGMPPGGAFRPGQPPVTGSPAVSLGPPKKKRISNSVKVVIAVTLVAAITITGFILKAQADKNAEAERINAIAAYFDDPKNIPDEIPLSGPDVNLVLRTLNSTASTDEDKREFLLQALTRGKASDGGNISEKVATFAKDTQMNEPLRAKLFRVVGRRGDESALPALIAFASETNETESGQAALRAAKEMATTSNFQSLLSIISNSINASIKSSARDILTGVISEAEDRSSYAQPIIAAYNTAADTESRSALLRLLGSAGGDQAADLVADNLESDNQNMQIAAIYALRDWPDDSQFEALLEFGKGESDRRLRKEAFSNLVEFLQENESVDPDDRFFYWSEVAVMAAGEGEQRQIVSAMGRQNERWADDVLDYFVTKGDTERVQAAAEDTKDLLATNISRANRGNRNKEDKEDDE